MDFSKKRPRADDKYERELLPDPTRLRLHDKHSDVPMSNPPHQNEKQYSLPEPPARAGRKPVSSQDNQGGSKFGTFVNKYIAANEYEHKPLSLNPSDDQIRLLILRPGDPGHIIQCRFLVLPLSDPDASGYEALSYYWGTERADREIRIEKENLEPEKNKSHPKKLSRNLVKRIRPQSFHIRPNLHEALTHLRQKNRDIVLWVDALCINQEDEREKTMQVQKMARIYSRAHRVLVWLGPSVTTLESSKKKCEEALDFIDEILNLASFDAMVKDEKSPPKWAALVELMCCDWFSRRWVVQELALASDATLHYNDKEINWKDFADAVAIFTTRFDTIKQLFLHSREFDHNVEHLGDVQALGAAILIDVTANHFRRSSEAQDDLERLSSLEALVSRLLTFEASDPRDTVYALLSICKEKHGLEGPGSYSLPVPDSTYPQNKLVPDYRKSIVEVYKDFTEYCVTTSRSIDIICRHWAPAGWSESATLDMRIHRSKKREKQKFKPKMPSWVPLLTDSPYGPPRRDQHSRVNGDSLVGHPDRKCYNASGGMGPEVRFENIPLGHTVSQPQSPRPPTPIAHRLEKLQSHHGAEPAHTGPSETDVLPTRSPSLSSASSLSQSNPSKSEPPRDQDHEESQVTAFFMFVTGIQIDTVTEVSSRIPPGLLTQECLKMGGWNGPNDPNDEIPDELWRTLVAGRGPDGGNPPGWYHRACWACFHLGTSSGDVNIASLITNPKTPSLMVEFLKRVQGIVWDKLFVRSQERKLFGLGPRGTQLGDRICVLFGCSVPVILRPQMDPSGSEIMHYEVVGESYIYGMMDGEAISKFLPETLLQEFKLG